MAILSIMVINNHGQPRLLKFYQEVVSPPIPAPPLSPPPPAPSSSPFHLRSSLRSSRPSPLPLSLLSPLLLVCAASRTARGRDPRGLSLVSKRSDSICNFLEGTDHWGGAVKLIYRHYATLYFIVAVDDSESELGILDLIQVFVEALDK